MAEKRKKARAKSMDKWKRKKWFNIVAPAFFNQKVIGETPAQKDSQVIGRTIVLTLDKLTGQRTQKHIDIKFRITELKGLNAHTEIAGHEIKQSYLNKIIRRRRSKIDVVTKANTRDGKVVKICSLALTARKIERSKETAIRKIMDVEVKRTIEGNNSNKIIEDSLFGALALRIFKQTKDIAPIKRIEITKSQFFKGN